VRRSTLMRLWWCVADSCYHAPRPGSIARAQEQVVHIYHKYWLPQHGGGGHGEPDQAVR
jgi:hypothetical protein